MLPPDSSHQIMISELPVPDCPSEGVGACRELSQIDSTPLHSPHCSAAAQTEWEKGEGRAAAFPCPFLSKLSPLLPPSFPLSLPNTVCLRLISKNYRLSRTISVRQKIDHNDLNFEACFLTSKWLFWCLLHEQKVIDSISL